MGLLDFMRRRPYVVQMNIPTVKQVLGYSAQELYDTQPALRAVVSFLADNVAHLPLHCYIRESDTSRARDTSSDLYLLLKQPTLNTTEHELIRDSVSDYLLYGWFAWALLPDTETESGWSLLHIPTSWFTSLPTEDGLEPVEYQFTNPQTPKHVTLPASDIIRFYAYGAGGPLEPASPINALKQVLSEQISAWNYRNSVWKNGGRVSAYLTRPKDAPEWSTDARDRFVKSWRGKYAGEDGTNAGGTPLLEDGMELKTTQFNAKEAEWSEATKLSREDVAAVYHVNPALIWHSDGETYASAKDNARALYSDTLGPLLNMMAERINEKLIPRLDVPSNEYVEFYLDAKLQGSFEERATVIQSSVGRPWMTVNEARGMSNLPEIENGDELTVPLNVEIGGLASPNDTDPTRERYNASESVRTPEIKARGTANTSDAMETASVLRNFFKRQKRSVISAINSAQKSGKIQIKADDFPQWWNADRWNKELADDLEPLFKKQAEKQAHQTLKKLKLDTAEYDPKRTEAYIRKAAEMKAKALNNVTFRELQSSLTQDWDDDALGSTPKGVYEKAEETRANVAGLSSATAIASWAVMEAVRQSSISNSQAVKTWIVTSGNPRPEHAALNGETVPLDSTFSNGATGPGDFSLDPEQTCNCQCELEVTIRSR